MKALRMEIWRYVVKLFSDKSFRVEFGSDISIKRSGVGVVFGHVVEIVRYVNYSSFDWHLKVISFIYA